MMRTTKESHARKAIGEPLQLWLVEQIRSLPTVTDPSMIQCQKMSAHGEELIIDDEVRRSLPVSFECKVAANGFGERSDEPYIQLVREMYPKVSFNLQNIIAEVLQDAEPLEEQPKKNKRDEIIKGVQDSYTVSGTPVDTADDAPIKMKGKVVKLTEEEKAEQLKDKILESLKLND